MVQPRFAAAALALRLISLSNRIWNGCGQDDVPDIGTAADDGRDFFSGTDDGNDAPSPPEANHRLSGDPQQNLDFSMAVSPRGVGHTSLMMRRHRGQASALEAGWSIRRHLGESSAQEAGRNRRKKGIENEENIQDPEEAKEPMGSRTLGEAPLREGSTMAIGKALAEEEALERAESDDSSGDADSDESESAVQIGEKSSHVGITDVLQGWLREKKANQKLPVYNDEQSMLELTSRGVDDVSIAPDEDKLPQVPTPSHSKEPKIKEAQEVFPENQFPEKERHDLKEIAPDESAKRIPRVTKGTSKASAKQVPEPTIVIDAKPDIEAHREAVTSPPVFASSGSISASENVQASAPAPLTPHDILPAHIVLPYAPPAPPLDLADDPVHAGTDSLGADTTSLGAYVNGIAALPSSFAASSPQEEPTNFWNTSGKVGKVRLTEHDCKEQEWQGARKVAWCSCMQSGTLEGTKYLMADFLTCDDEGNAKDTDKEHSKLIHKAMQFEKKAQCDLLALSAKCVADVGCQGDKHQNHCEENQAALPHCNIDCEGLKDLKPKDPKVNAHDDAAQHSVCLPLVMLAVAAALELMF